MRWLADFWAWLNRPDPCLVIAARTQERWRETAETWKRVEAIYQGIVDAEKPLASSGATGYGGDAKHESDNTK